MSTDDTTLAGTDPYEAAEAAAARVLRLEPAPVYETALTWADTLAREPLCSQPEPRSPGGGWVPFASGAADGRWWTRWRRLVADPLDAAVAAGADYAPYKAEG